MNDFRHIAQASNAICKIPADRRELALQYIWKMVQPAEVVTPPPLKHLSRPNGRHDRAVAGA